MGRGTKLNELVQDIIVKGTKKFMTVDAICAKADISRETYYSWLKWGREGREPFAALSLAVDQALAAAQEKLLDTVWADAGKDGKDALELLRIRFPHEYGKVQRHEHSGPDGGPINIATFDLSLLTIDEIKEFKRLSEKSRVKEIESGDGK